ncbi:hypothetical protein ACH9D2_14890 [Kocuria sp. M4R2S49]|uniref:hypothetical protein n=1 Tax=Kocuria rhizosphaericola TaxID=3376284 RepID=UPI0037B3F6DD
MISKAHLRNYEIALITTTEALNHPNYDLHLAHLEQQFTTHLIPNADVKTISRLTQSLRTDIMVLPDGDAFVWKEAWKLRQKRHGSVSAVVMRPNSSGKGSIKPFIIELIKRLLLTLANMQPDVIAVPLKSSLWTSQNNQIGVPDPVSFHPDRHAPSMIETAIASNPDRKWLGILGALSARKNIDLVLRSARIVDRSDFGIVLAGHMEPAVAEKIQDKLYETRKKGIEIIVCNTFLTDGELDAILQKLHCVVLAHSNEGPSGILGKAVEAGTFILAAGAKSLREDCRLLPESSHWSPLNEQDLADAIDVALTYPTPIPKQLNTGAIFSESLLQQKG